MTAPVEFISFRDKLTGRQYTATWAAALEAMAQLKEELNRTPSRDELLFRLVRQQEGGELA